MTVLMGFGKVFECMFTGSLMGSGAITFTVMTYAIVNARPPGIVEINPKLLAMLIGCEECEVDSALDYLQQPDPRSRSKDEDGRRLVSEGGFTYRVVNYMKYRSIRDEAERREQNRLSKIRQRERESADSQQSQPRQPESAQAYASASASVSASSPSVQGEVQEREPRKKKVGLSWDVPCPEDVDPELWTEWLGVRKAKRLSPPTERAITKIRNDAEDRGMSLYAALQHCCERGYGGFYPDDDNKRGKR